MAASGCRRVRVLPSAAALLAPKIRPELAPRVLAEKLARIEPVLRHRTREDRRELAREVCDVRTPMVPKRPAIRDGRKAKNLLDAAVAVRRDDEHAPGQLEDRGFRKSKHDIVVKFALRPVRHEIVGAEATRHLGEQRPEVQSAAKVVERERGRHADIVRSDRGTRMPSGR